LACRNSKFLLKFLESDPGLVMEIFCLVAVLVVFYTENGATTQPKLQGITKYLHRWSGEDPQLNCESYYEDHRKTFVLAFLARTSKW